MLINRLSSSPLRSQVMSHRVVRLQDRLSFDFACWRMPRGLLSEAVLCRRRLWALAILDSYTSDSLHRGSRACEGPLHAKNSGLLAYASGIIHSESCGLDPLTGTCPRVPAETWFCRLVSLSRWKFAVSASALPNRISCCSLRRKSL